MAIITIQDSKGVGHIFDPSALEVGIQDVSSPDAGRDLTGTMAPMKIAVKFTLKLEWWEVKPSVVAEVLSCLYTYRTNPGTNGKIIVPRNYISVAFWNPITGKAEKRTFYAGDKTLPVRMWKTAKNGQGVTVPTNRAWYAKMSFNLIEI